jgi:RNA polymerase-associated protein RTF1
MSSESEDDYLESNSESEPSLDDDLTYGPKDAAWLSTLTDVQREEVFFERFAKKKEEDERKKILGIKKKEKKTKPTSLKAKKKTRQAAIENLVHSKKSRSAKRQRSSESDVDDYDKFSQVNEQDLEPMAPELTFDDILKATVTRSKLTKWYGEPFFSNNVKNLFVRIGYGGQGHYKLAEIVAIVDATKPYLLGNKQCYHLAQLKIGESVKRYELEYISNSPLTRPEFEDWLHAMRFSPHEIPNKAQIEALVEQIDRSDHYVYTPEDFKEQIRKNKEQHPHLTKLSQEILKLKALIEEEEDETKLEMLKRQLKEAEQKAEEKKKLFQNKVGKSLENINKRNQNINHVLTRTHFQDEDYDQDDGNAFRQTATKSSNAWVASKKLAQQQKVQADMHQEHDSLSPVAKKPRTDSIQADSVTVNSTLVTLENRIDRTINTDLDSMLEVKVSDESSEPVQNRLRSLSQSAQTLSLAQYKQRLGLS